MLVKQLDQPLADLGGAVGLLAVVLVELTPVEATHGGIRGCAEHRADPVDDGGEVGLQFLGIAVVAVGGHVAVDALALG